MGHAAGAREREGHGARRLSIVPDEDGMYEVRGRLSPEVGAVLMRALEAAEDALFRKERSGEEEREFSYETRSPRQARIEAARRRADAVGLLAERALS